MRDDDRPGKSKQPSRREILRTGLAAGGAAVAGPAIAAAQGKGNPANQPPNVADWLNPS